MLSLFPPQILQPSSKDPKISSSIAADHLDSPFTIPLIVYSVCANKKPYRVVNTQTFVATLINLYFNQKS